MLTLFAAVWAGASTYGASRTAGYDAPGADPRAGSWTLVSAQSALNPPDKLTVTDLQGAVHVVMAGETHLNFTVQANGHDTAVPGNPAFDQIELHRMGKKQAVVTEKKAGGIVATIQERISKDGNELTITTTSRGRAPEVTVWTRSPSAKVADDPVAGEWVEDLNKTRLRQGLTLKIEADPSGGVRFASSYSYTARFDGKPYDVKNSHNDTVSLQLVDPHTVEEAFRRDNQVTERDKWTVSPDGRSMTLNSTATLETGQHLTETLVFQKQ